MTPDPAVRRQERGRRRIEAILDAAEELFAEVGYDAASTNLIAARAGISPGSLYQYFANKPAIAEGLARRYVDLLDATDGATFDAATTGLPLPELVDRTVDPMVRFHLAHPGAKALTVAADASPELAVAIASLHDAMCGRVDVLIAARAPHLSVRDRELASAVTIQIFSGLLATITSAGRRERPRVVRELKAALTGYWQVLEAR